MRSSPEYCIIFRDNLLLFPTFCLRNISRKTKLQALWFYYLFPAYLCLGIVKCSIFCRRLWVTFSYRTFHSELQLNIRWWKRNMYLISCGTLFWCNRIFKLRIISIQMDWKFRKGINISESWYILLYLHALWIPLTVSRRERRKEIKMFVFSNPVENVSTRNCWTFFSDRGIRIVFIRNCQSKGENRGEEKCLLFLPLPWNVGYFELVNITKGFHRTAFSIPWVRDQYSNCKRQHLRNVCIARQLSRADSVIVTSFWVHEYEFLRVSCT